jgi:hypothetical protein
VAAEWCSLRADVSSQMLELYEQTKDGSGTTGASSRRQSKGHPPSKAAGTKSKGGGHPTTPSVADRAAQVSLTSGASTQPVPGPPQAPLPRAPPKGEEGSAAREGGVTPVAPTGPGVPATEVKQVGKKETEVGSGSAQALKQEENRTARVEAPPVTGALGEAGDAGTLAHSKLEVVESARGRMPGKGIHELVGPERVVKVEVTKAEVSVSGGRGGVGPHEGRWGAGLASLEADKPEGLGEGAPGEAVQDIGGGEALDEPMDVDDGPSEAGPEQAPQPTREAPAAPPHGGPPQGEGQRQSGPKLAGVSVEDGPLFGSDVKGGKAQGEGQGAEAQGEGEEAKSADEGRATEGGERKAVRQETATKLEQATPVVEGAEPAPEEGEIPSEDGEIPSSPVSACREGRSPSKGSRERARSGRGQSRSRSRSPSRDGSRGRSRSPSTKRRRTGQHSR